MNGKISLASLGLVALLVGACGGSSSPTQQPGGGSTAAAATTGPIGGEATEVPAATQQPAATQGGSGGGTKPAGWDQFGKVHVDMGGPVNKSADYGFVPAGSIFGGAQGSSLNFTVDGTDEVVSILVGADGKVVVSYGGADFSMPAAECTTSNWNIGATSGSGSFDCTAALTIMGSGATVTGGTLKGSFDAHA